MGTSEVATDPEAPSTGDAYIMLKPRAEWPDPKKSKAALVAEIEKAAEEIPGSSYEISQPIQRRFNELISGVRADVGVKVFGDAATISTRSAPWQRRYSRCCRA